ncbi:MAG: DUF3891 family protein [candidate division NC10 bacterium]|nr:DUF3891 family protein [candidate division NC10 bacterium]
MIRRALDGHWLCIGQPEHAQFAGAMAEAWGHPPFRPPVPRAEVLRAVAEHDNGWLEWEAAPGLDPGTGRPLHFTEMPVAEHLAIWRRGVQRMLEANPYAGLLVSMHGAALMRFRLERAARTGEPDRASLRAFLAEQERLQAALREGLGLRPRYRDAVRPARLTANFRLLQLLDALSLLLCCGEREPQTFTGVPLGEGHRRTDLAVTPAPDGAALAPYPFTREPAAFAVTGRLLPVRPFPDPAALHAAWAQAPERRLTFTLRAGTPGA